MNMTKFAAFILALSFCLTSQAQVPPKQDPVKPKVVVEKTADLPTKPEYDKALKHYTDWKTKFNDIDYWKDVTLTRVSDKKEFKLKDLSDYEKSSFYLSSLRRCGFEMTRLNGFWEGEVKTPPTPTQEGVPTVEDLKKYIGQLTKLRKETAVSLEEYATKFVKDNSTKVTKEEGEQLLKAIKDYHDEQKLIERK